MNTADLAGGKWKEVLAIVSQYGKAEEVQILCDKLAQRLENQGDSESVSTAILCYMCAFNIEKVVTLWRQQQQQQQKDSGGGCRCVTLSDIQNVMEKTSLFQMALPDPTQVLSNPFVMKLYCDYASILVSEGQIDLAVKFLSPVSAQIANTNNNDDVGQATTTLRVLCDRIYGAHPNPQSLSNYLVQPHFPFEYTEPGTSSNMCLHFYICVSITNPFLSSLLSSMFDLSFVCY